MKEPAKPRGTALCIDNRIRRNTVWASLTADEIDLFNRQVICRIYTRGETVFVEGDPCKGLYFIEAGLVGIRKIDQDGHSALVRLASRDDTMGYRPFLACQAHRASAEVIEDARICFVDAPTVRKFLQDNHELGHRFLKQTAQALGEAEERLFKMAVLNVDIRFIHLLLLYHDQWGLQSESGSITIRLPITRDDLAAMIGAHPDSVTRALRQLESKGLMRVDGRLIHIDEFDLLADQLHLDLAYYH